MVETVNYIGINASEELYKRLKKRTDKLEIDYTNHQQRIEVIESEATNVQRITEKQVHIITGYEEQPTINYTE